MNRTRAFLVSLAVGLAAIAGVFALGHTLTLGHNSQAANNRLIARKTAQLNRYELALRKALAQKPPALPTASASTSTSPSVQSVPVRVVYHRPPPIVVVKHRAGGEHEQDQEQGHEGVGADD